MTFVPPTYGPLWLASRSPRRRRMLDEAGVEVTIHPAGIDDGCLRPGRVAPPDWVMALAYLKGRWVADALVASGLARTGTVLAADTLCVHEGNVLGQPADVAHARTMLHALRNATHETITGVCLIALATDARWMFQDRAIVRVGAIDDETIERYLSSEAWRGKAGAYNLQDRIDDGWQIECDGDPATVMGLPMRRLAPWLAEVRRRRP